MCIGTRYTTQMIMVGDETVHPNVVKKRKHFKIALQMKQGWISAALGIPVPGSGYFTGRNKQRAYIITKTSKYEKTELNISAVHSQRLP